MSTQRSSRSATPRQVLADLHARDGGRDRVVVRARPSSCRRRAASGRTCRSGPRRRRARGRCRRRPCPRRRGRRPGPRRARRPSARPPKAAPPRGSRGGRSSVVHGCLGSAGEPRSRSMRPISGRNTNSGLLTRAQTTSSIRSRNAGVRRPVGGSPARAAFSFSSWIVVASGLQVVRPRDPAGRGVASAAGRAWRPGRRDPE